MKTLLSYILPPLLSFVATLLRADADEYGYDASRVVIAGASAGGHLLKWVDDYASPVTVVSR